MCTFEGSSSSLSDFENRSVGSKGLTYTHFSHALEITVSAMSDNNQVVGLGVRIGRAETAVGT